MWSLVTLILLTIFLYIRLKKILDKNFRHTKSNHELIQSEYEKLLSRNAKLKTDNSVLAKTAEETIVLYDLTREICKSLDQDKVFSNFCEQINRYIGIGDCKFIKEEADLSKYNNYIVLPLNLDKQILGYLVVNQVKEEDKDKFHILTQQFLLGIKRAFLYQQVQELAITDSLTGVFSRRYLMERLNEEIERSQKFNYEFSLLMVDVDHFKDYNDRYGHLVGDAILKEISKTIKENTRSIDLLGRYGGEEFSIVLAETDKEGAKFAAERIRSSIENKNIRVYDEDLKVTISVGVSTYPLDGSKPLALIERSDEALYQAKKLGRNRVCLYSAS